MGCGASTASSPAAGPPGLEGRPHGAAALAATAAPASHPLLGDAASEEAADFAPLSAAPSIGKLSPAAPAPGTPGGLPRGASAVPAAASPPSSPKFDGAKEAAKKGVHVMKKLLEKLTPMLIFPGTTAIMVLTTIVDMVDGAVANHDNLRALRDRSLDLAQVLVAYGRQHRPAAEEEAFVSILGRFKELMDEIAAYARDYADRSVIAKLLFSSGHAEAFEELAGKLREVTRDATFAMTADTQSKVSAMVSRLEAATAYVDEAARLKAMVESAGGSAAVLADDGKMAAVVAGMGAGDALQLEAVRQLRQLVEASDTNGPYRLIEHPYMRGFWATNIRANAGEWRQFWMAFERNSGQLLPDAARRPELAALLQGKAARDAFECAVGGVWPPEATVSLASIAGAFNDEAADALTICKELVGGAMMLPPTSAKGAAAGGEPPKLFRCLLPAQEANFIGREADIEAIAAALGGAGGARGVALVAPSGMGKTGLAVAAGWRLARSGVASESLLVNLSNVDGGDALVERFASAFGADGEDAAGASAADIGASARALCQASGGVLLLVVDGCQDALAAPGGTEQLAALLAALLGASPCVRLLLTSSEPLPAMDAVSERAVAPLDRGSAAAVAQAAVPGLPGAETAAVVAAAAGNPLLLRLLSDGVASGTISATRMAELSNALAGVEIAVETLGVRHQMSLLALSAFRQPFGAAAAGAVLAKDVEATRATLRQLAGKSLALHDRRADRYALQPAVRQAIQAMAPRLPGGALALAKARARAVKYGADLLVELGAQRVAKGVRLVSDRIGATKERFSAFVRGRA